MKIVDRLEDTLEGNYKGLYSEVVTFDSYKIREIKFTPNVVFDLGANVGVFTRFARERFPNAFIVSVEPDEENYEHLIQFTDPHNIRFLNAAVGEGRFVKRIDSNSRLNGAHASYLPENILSNTKYTTPVAPITVRLDRLFSSYVKTTDKVLVKIDVEGAEFCMFNHEPTLLCLERTNYFAFELHHEMEYYTEEEKEEKRKVVSDFIKRFSKTHFITHEHPMLFGTKK